METLTLPTVAETGVLLTDNNFVYVGMNTIEPNQEIYRICSNNMTYCGKFSGLIATTDRFIWGMKDLSTDYLYFGSGMRDPTSTDLGSLVKVSRSTLSYEFSLQLFPQAGSDYYPTSMQIQTSKNRIFAFAEVENHLGLRTAVDVLDVSGGFFSIWKYLECFVAPFYYWTESIILGDEVLIAFGSNGVKGTPSYAMNITLSAVDLGPPNDCVYTVYGPLAGLSDITSVTTDSKEQFLFLTLGTSPGKIVRVSRIDFSILDTFTMAGTEGTPYFSVITDDRYLWTATNTTPSTVIRLDMTDFSNIKRTPLTNARNIINVAYSSDIFPTLYLGSWDGRVSKVYVGVCKPGTRLPLPCVKCNPGTYSELEDANSCTPCKRGFFSTVTASNSSKDCIICPAGHVSNISASNSIKNCTVCGPGTYANFTVCLKCPIGTFHNLSIGYNQSACIPCKIGSYADSPGSTICTLCSKGYYSTTFGGDSIAVCLPCIAGTYSTILGANSSTACIPCPIGYVSNITHSETSSDCKLCPIGTYANTTICKDCVAGSYNNLTGRWLESQCLKCPAGQYQPNVKSSNCMKCLAGRYSIAIGAIDNTVCQQCPAGTWSSTIGANSPNFCIKCLNGSTSAAIGATSNGSCIPCGIGKLEVNNVCVDCPVGTFGNYTGAWKPTDCHPCGAGKYQDIPGSITCKICPAGTYSSNLKATDVNDCLPCGFGKYSDYGAGAPNSSVCKSCPAGTWSNVPVIDSVTKCVKCEAGKYSTIIGSQTPLDCVSCDVGTYNMIPGASNSSMCIRCIPGYFSNKIGADSNTTCTICPEGTYAYAYASSSCINCQPTSYCPPGSSFEMPTTPTEKPRIGVFDPQYNELSTRQEYWWVRIIVLFSLLIMLCVITSICFALVCCYYKNPIDVCSCFDCLFARLHYTMNDEPITRNQNLFGGCCTLCACYLILIFFVLIFSVFFSANIETKSFYVNSGIDSVELVGDPQYTKGKYSIHMLLYGVFTSTTCNPAIVPSSTFYGTSDGTLETKTKIITGGVGCEVTWTCSSCEITGIRNSLSFNFPAGSFATGVIFDVSFPSLLSEDGDFQIEGNMNADPLHILSGISNPSVIVYQLHKSEYRKKTIVSSFVDLFDENSGVTTEYGMTGNWDDIVVGDQIKSGTGQVVSSGLGIEVLLKVHSEKFIMEDVVKINLVTFLIQLAGSIIIVMFILGCCMRCCECFWFRVIRGRKKRRFHEINSDGNHKYGRVGDTVIDGHLMKTALGDDLSTPDQDMEDAPRELVDAIVDVGWKEGLNSVELAESDSDGETPGMIQGMELTDGKEDDDEESEEEDEDDDEEEEEGEEGEQLLVD